MDQFTHSLEFYFWSRNERVGRMYVRLWLFKTGRILGLDVKITTNSDMMVLFIGQRQLR